MTSLWFWEETLQPKLSAWVGIENYFGKVIAWVRIV
jgi:hypothetical protein